MIVLEKIEIKNFRKFSSEKITFDENITAIAGSNNSGKTSLVELLSNIFVEKKETMNVEDMYVKSRIEDELKVQGIIENPGLSREDKLDMLKAIHKQLNKIEIYLTVKYTKDTDDLQLFSKFLADVDINKRNFYFKYLYEYAPPKEEEIINALDGITNYTELFLNLNVKIYYCSETFNEEILIANRKDFYNLFNVHCVYAIRKLSDTSNEKQNYLTKQLLATVKNNSQWKDNLQKLIEAINTLLRNQNLSKEIDTITVSNIKDTLDNFKKTSGGNSGSFGVDFELEKKDIERVLLEFTHIYFEQDVGLKIKESKQGLGYSNLVYLLLEIQRFNERFESKKVNILIFEEPEAHLHPQMENVFIRYICGLKITTPNGKKVMGNVVAGINDAEVFDVDKMNEPDEYSHIQMLITTHSTEMTRTIDIDKMRVLRSKNALETKVYDLNVFLKVSNNKLFYKKFFQFNIIEIIFADKVILFEGDAERLLLKYLIANEEKYETLSSQYISYIQVGGAYAYKYLELIEFLGIKTLIFTDIDYEYNSEKDFYEINSEIMQEYNEIEIINEIEKRKTTNETIIKVLEDNNIESIFNNARINKGIYMSNSEICLKFQTEEDGYARTLEDAILYNLANVKTVFTRISKMDFDEFKEKQGIIISSTKKQETSLRDRVDKLKNKTDFMYALIESGVIKNAIPKYIEEGLDWLKA